MSKTVCLSVGTTNYVPARGLYVMGKKNKSFMCKPHRDENCNRGDRCQFAHDTDGQRRCGHVKCFTDLPEEEAAAMPMTMQVCR